MFQKFNENNIVSKFIKGLLRNTNIPTLQIWKPGKAIIAGFTYVTKDYIVTAKKDWNPEDNTIGPISSTDINYFNIIEPYIEGDFYRGITSNYTSNTSIYDSDTHEALGNYLRMIRDLHDLNLMPYYNCWGGLYSDLIRLKNIGNEIILNQYTEIQKDGYKLIMVPIKFNTPYTIYINTDTPILIASTYTNKDRLLNSNDVDIFDAKSINRISYQKPFLYSGVLAKGEVINNSSTNTLLEEYLTLLIQLPERNNSPILVLEGDYTENRLINVYDELNHLKLDNKLKQVVFGNYTNLSSNDYNKCFTSPSSLTRNISSNNYAFNDRLIEYLLLNVISKNDTISKNIERVQKYISSYKSLKEIGDRYNYLNYVQGVWDEHMQLYIYNLVSNIYKNPLCVDINGFVDKDTEQIILRGKN